ncbi:caspase family protein [bacterium]|nr:caspase family protein [bacterium]NUN44719.1 caspase family protein [bacterium]
MNRFLLLILLVSDAAFAQDTRGLKLIAKDQKGIPQELTLYQKTYAVIIGIDRYKNLDFNQQLKNAVSDAKGIKKLLSDKFVFDKFYELYDENATKESILKTLQGDLSKTGPDDAIFVFFAGHGYTQNGIGGEDVGFIIPSDGSFSDDAMYKNVSMVELRDNISKTLKAKHIFYVMDACYSGTLLKRGAEVKEKTVDYSYLKSITASNVRQVLTAGGKSEQVLDGGPQGHSVFTGRLIEKLEQTENYITASELGLYIPKKVFSDAVDRNHKQNPQFGNLLGEGDFVFITKAAQNVNSEDVLAKELALLQNQNKQLEDQKNEKARLENLKKQQELKAQMSALEEKKKLAEIEEARRLEEQKKTIEENKRKQELLARIVEEKKKQVTIGYGITLLQAIERIGELQDKMAKVEIDFDEQKQKAITLAVDETPRGEFETQQEYNTRLYNNNQRRKQVDDEYEVLKARSKKAFLDEVAAITSKKYNVFKDRLSVKLGTYNVDGGYFPVTVIEAQEIDSCDKNPIQNTVNSKIYAQREDAKTRRRFVPTSPYLT